jgi:ParB family chromosome partitioning protein
VREAEEAVRYHNVEADAEPEDPGTTPAPTASGSPSTAAKRLRAPGLLELEELLAFHLNTRVSVTMAGADGKGKVVVEFAGLEDLERVYRAMTTGSGD